LFVEDVFVCVGGVVVGVVGGVVGGVVVGVVGGVVGGVVVGVVGGVVVGVVGGDDTGVVARCVTGGEVARLAGAVEGAHVTLTGAGPIPPGAATFRGAEPTECATPSFVHAPTVWLGPCPTEGGMYPIPLEWRAVAVPLVPPEPWLRHWALPGAIVARNGFPAMYVAVPVGIRVAPLDCGLPGPPALLPPPGPELELSPRALSSCAPSVLRSRGIDSVNPRTRTRAVAVASAGRSQMPGVRSACRARRGQRRADASTGPRLEEPCAVAATSLATMLPPRAS